MEKVSIPAFTHVVKSYCLLIKPGILFGNALTATAGFVLATPGAIDLRLFLAMVFGLSFIMASGCVLNNYIDRDADAKMSRTQHRPLVVKSISVPNAMIFAVFLGLLGVLLLTFFTNLLTVAIALFGFVVYVILYSFSKYVSVHGTLIGSIAGAVPPVIGYSAVSNHLDWGALILFAMLITWQMPHFFAIAIYRLEDYAKADIPVLPFKKGILVAKLHMLFYIATFIITSSLLTIFQYTGYVYLVIVAILGGGWLGLCIAGFKDENSQLWARKMFLFSLVVITVLCFAICLKLVF